MITTRTIAVGIASVGLTLCLATGAGIAAPRPGGGGQPGGGHPGGVPHMGGGAPHMGGGAPHMGGGAPHMGGGAPHVGGGVPHIGGGAPHFAAHIGGGGPHFAPRGGGGVPHFAGHVGGGRPHFAPHIGGHGVSRHIGRAGGIGRGPHVRFGRGGAHVHIAHGGRSPFGHGVSGAAAHRVFPHAPHAFANAHGPAAGGHIAHLAGRPDPARFAHLRDFHGFRAFRPFLAARWHPHHHLGWIGPLFWPYAYGDVFYDALWPYAYASYDPFWYYGYDDIYEGIFSPYDYGEYVQGRQAPARMRSLTQSAAESCNDEAAEVTGWPIGQIQAALSPSPQQTALLDDLGNAILKASDVIRSHCPTKLAFTPTDRLAEMQQRLEGLAEAVSIVQPPLAKFYASLSDEQKARFNDIGNTSARPPASGQGSGQSPQATCSDGVMAFPTDQVDRVVQPDAAQRAKLDALAAASAKAADQIKASCPSTLPATPPDRLAAEGRHLQAMLAAVQTIRPALADFYGSLSDEQKARFNTVGRQLFAEK